MDTYQLLDSGNGKKWERFGDFILCRPCAQAIWRPEKKIDADALFSREGANRWTLNKKIPKSWNVSIDGVQMTVSLTDFGHIGVFPEHASLWKWIRSNLEKGDEVLNLFAYSGGASMAAAQKGANVCHLDAAKGMVDWGKENASLNHLSNIRWIVDDAMKFLKREEKRGRRYEGIILDPPTFGRGARGEIFKIEEEMIPLLEACKNVLSSKPKFLLLTSHTPGFTPTVLQTLIAQVFRLEAESGEMLLSGMETFPIPSGAFARVKYGN